MSEKCCRLDYHTIVGKHIILHDCAVAKHMDDVNILESGWVWNCNHYVDLQASNGELKLFNFNYYIFKRKR